MITLLDTVKTVKSTKGIKIDEDAVHAADYQMQQRTPNGHWVSYKRLCKAIQGVHKHQWPHSRYQKSVWW